jgi:hypothetical protein
MSLRILKEHLPWIAPTTAIVLAATGVISFGPKEAAPVSASSDFEVSRTVTQNPVALGEQGIGLVPQTRAASRPFRRRFCKRRSHRK